MVVGNLPSVLLFLILVGGMAKLLFSDLLTGIVNDVLGRTRSDTNV